MFPAQNGLLSSPGAAAAAPRKGKNAVQTDLSRDRNTPNTPSRPVFKSTPHQPGPVPQETEVHQTAAESFHSRGSCENPGTYGHAA